MSKMGRNDPCLCGSGQKFKKCCGRDQAGSLKTKTLLRETILKVVDEQMRALDPPQTKATYDRLIEEGCCDEEARELIAVVVTCEIYDVSKRNEPFNEERFVMALDQLPVLPWEE